ncbi:MAG: enoyl-CoA hydratase/isomerase family protein [Burkholderiaceae bacterium]|nr:enoyl-CoA hydratase/isomerase family protein [Burkholderiaceae bacterium]MDO9089040.1 enoyl-CoA hydratase/isomerase family protein [Burkholderiaceae bacterium]
MQTEFIHSERHGSLGWLILNRPAAANAVNEAMHAALVHTLNAATQDASLHALVLTAAGDGVFCAGADLKELSQQAQQLGDPVRAAQAGSERLLRTLLALIDFPKPLVCAVQARAIGAGAMFALTCDVIVAAESASFSFPEIALGVPSPMGVAMVEARAPALVRGLVLRGESIDAVAARSAGLVDSVVPAERLRAEAARCATDIRSNEAYAATKRWVHRDLRRRLIEAADESARLRGLRRAEG